MFMFDVETLNAESTAVVLSASIIHFEVGQKYSYEDLLARALFVKFDAKEQIEKYKRSADKETIEWWSKQDPAAKEEAFGTEGNVFESRTIERWYANNSRLWFRNEEDLAAFLLRWA